MSQELLVERLFETLINGDRTAARAIVQDSLSKAGATKVITGLFWPAYELIEKLHRSDQMTSLSYHFSTRLLRQLIDQAAASLERPSQTRFRVFTTCGPSESEELGAQMAVDLLETAGYQVTFAGGGVPADEILAQTQATKPDVLLMFASAAADLPGIRSIIDQIREIGACSSTRICVGAGVFNRAEGLAEEIGADLFAPHPLDLIHVLDEAMEERTQGVKHRNLRQIEADRIKQAQAGKRRQAA
jgi:methanogenic corrinoid protein MtbC1